MSKSFTIMTLAAILLTGFCFAQDHPGRLQIVGKCTVFSMPENIVIGIPVNVTDSLYIRCSDILMNRLNRIQGELIEKGINKDLIKTLNLSISENNYYDNGKMIKAGHRGYALLQITDKFSIRNLEDVLDVLNKNESSYSVSFDLSDTQIERLNEQAINFAIEDACKKADIIAKASKSELGRIVKITYDYSNYGNDPLMLSREEEVPFMVGGIINLRPKERSVEKKVLVEWEIK
ncbi:MAG: SIMPL domain-containing protein [Bacteroidales bacterium]|nr:SIMPL domain-containing protein [Bacteroidales bacterium]MDD3989482.1 SIMPL domain-containing protein [Bacteroidales bacterium]MDD4638366.1 SIMPL domain-containing protein [Bacteroidales bacterium]